MHVIVTFNHFLVREFVSSLILDYCAHIISTVEYSGAMSDKVAIAGSVRGTWSRYGGKR